MNLTKSALTTYASTALFVLLWSSGAIFSRWALDDASPFVFLLARFGLALAALLVIAVVRGEWLPRPGTRIRTAVAGSLLIGGYSSCYFLALDRGITPGILATIMGVQPILTLVILERRFAQRRLAGLVLALSGLSLVVFDGDAGAHFTADGMAFAIGALASMTIGAILQKRIQQAPTEVLPLQYSMSLLMCLSLVSLHPVRLELTARLLVSWLWIGLVFSVAAQLLFYRLIHRGNLVNVTSLFYLVPIVTAVLDYLLLGNLLPLRSLLGMVVILSGVALVSGTSSAKIETG